MELLISWMTELNRSNHTGFAVLTVLTMIGFGGFIASLIELIFAALGIRWDRSGIHR
jgi:hypothetical protein